MILPTSTIAKSPPAPAPTDNIKRLASWMSYSTFAINVASLTLPEAYRSAAAADSNFSYWHSATFNNDGTKVLFSDEWGGGGAPKCRITDRREWGADAIFTLTDANGTPIMVRNTAADPAGDKMQFQNYYKLPAAQTKEENCVAHNGSLVPIPGRDVMVQAW